MNSSPCTSLVVAFDHGVLDSSKEFNCPTEISFTFVNSSSVHVDSKAWEMKERKRQEFEVVFNCIDTQEEKSR